MASPAEFLKELRRHLGYSEPANGVTPYGVWYSRRVGDAQFRNDPWCAMFVSYCGDKTNSPVGQFAWTVAQAKWFKARGRFDRKPRRGSLVFFDWGGSHDLDRIDHVGVVEQVRKDGTLVTLEGNTSDRVARRVRTMSTVVGFGHPEWEKKPVKHERKWRVVATTRFGGVRIIYRLNGGGYSWNPKKGSRAVLTAHQVTEAKKWAKRHAAKTVRTVPLDGWTHLRLDPSTRWPTDQALLRRLNRVGRRLNRGQFSRFDLGSARRKRIELVQRRAATDQQGDRHHQPDTPHQPPIHWPPPSTTSSLPWSISRYGPCARTSLSAAVLVTSASLASAAS